MNRFSGEVRTRVRVVSLAWEGSQRMLSRIDILGAMILDEKIYEMTKDWWHTTRWFEVKFEGGVANLRSTWERENVLISDCMC